MQKCLGILLCAAFVLLSFYSCSKNDDPVPPGPCDSISKSFSINVNPIVQSTCNQVGCHASGSFNGPGAITNYNQVFNARVAIRAAIASGFMPQGTTLTQAQREAIICWIDSGAPDN